MYLPLTFVCLPTITKSLEMLKILANNETSSVIVEEPGYQLEVRVGQIQKTGGETYVSERVDAIHNTDDIGTGSRYTNRIVEVNLIQGYCLI